MSKFLSVIPNIQFIPTSKLLEGYLVEDIYNPITFNWLMVDVDGVEMMLGDRSLVRGVSWDSLHNSNNVFGNKVVEFNGIYYSVSLMRGCVAHHAINDSGRVNLSDWYKFFSSIVTPNELLESFMSSKSMVDTIVVEKDNTLIDLSNLYHSYNWCQEALGIVKHYRVNIGGSSLFSRSGKDKNTCIDINWLPVLTKLNIGV